MLFVQIRDKGDNFSYVIADESSKEAVVVDPSFSADAIFKLATEKGLKIKYVIDTHCHQDHTAGNQQIKSRFDSKIVSHKASNIGADIQVADGDTIEVGKEVIRIIHTPGHTTDSICLFINGKLLTGDTLFVGECGRTDLPGGSSKDMYDSLFNKILRLDDKTEVYPGHDYGPRTSSTIGEERRTNYTLKKRSLEEFIEFMGLP
jgi:glyoxylase-like metal-dependent hydrolase (beta-lactamase superfamily II)